MFFNALVYASSDVHIIRPRFGLFPQGSVLAGFFFGVRLTEVSLQTVVDLTYIFLIPGRNGKN